MGPLARPLVAPRNPGVALKGLSGLLAAPSRPSEVLKGIIKVITPKEMKIIKSTEITTSKGIKIETTDCTYDERA